MGYLPFKIGRSLSCNRIDADWARNILNALFTPLAEFVREFVSDFLKHLARNENAARVCNLLKSGSYIHPVSKNITVTLDNYVSEIDPDPQQDGPRGVQRRLDLKRLLDRNGGLHCLNRARELHQEAVSSCLEYAAAVFGNLRFNRL